MAYPTHLLPTTVVGSYPQPDWLVDRATLHAHGVPRTHAHDMWRVAEPWLEQAQDDATHVGDTRDGAGGDRHHHGRGRTAGKLFQPLRAGAGGYRCGAPRRRCRRAAGARRRCRAWWAKSAGAGRWKCAMSSSCCATPAARRRSRCRGRSPCRSRRRTRSMPTKKRWRWTTPSRSNEELRALKATSVDVVQLDEPWVRTSPEKATRYGMRAINRALEGIEGPTVVHLCFGYAAVVPAETKPSGYSFLPQLADTVAQQISIEAAQPKLDLGGAAGLVGQADHAGRAGPGRSGGRDGRDGGGADPRGAEVRGAGAADSGTGLRDEIFAARDGVREVAGAGGGCGDRAAELAG